MVNTRAHAVTDYLVALILLLAPVLFDFGANGAAYHVCVATAFILSVLTAFTRFEYALMRIVPLRVHMWIDTVVGTVLAISPFVFEFRDQVFKPHLVFGISIVVMAALTDRVLYEQVKDKKDEKKEESWISFWQKHKDTGR